MVFFSAITMAQEHKISVTKAHQLSLQNQLLLIDIRSEQEWRDTGVAPQALTLSMHQAGGLSSFTQQLLSLLKGNKNTPIALICAGGVRSHKVQQYLIRQGFNKVSDVSQGMLGGFITKGWIDQGLPITTYPQLNSTIMKKNKDSVSRK